MPRPKTVRDESYFSRPDFPHGTNAGYARRCKCDACKRAHSQNVQANWLKLNPEPRAPYRKHGGDPSHPDFPHGTLAGHRAKCRCGKCVEARHLYNAAYDLRNRRVGGAGFAKKAASNAAWRRSRKGIIAARKGNATRAARKKRASISVGREENRLIGRIYDCCPEGFEVDHIVPLQRGGAHVPSNLQYLPLRVNRQKGGRAVFDVSQYVVRWQDLLEAPSTTIP